MNCSFCGTENQEEARFCLACGAPLGIPPSKGMEPDVTIVVDDSSSIDRSSTPQPESLFEEPAPPQEPEPVLISPEPLLGTPKRKNTWIIVVLIIVFVLCCLAVVCLASIWSYLSSLVNLSY